MNFRLPLPAHPVVRSILFCAACIFFGWIAAFAMAPVSFWPCMFIGLSGLYYLYSRTHGAGQAFGAGFFFALGYFVTGLWWIGNALLVDGNEFAWVWPISVIGLPSLLALFTGTYLAMARLTAAPQSWKGFFAFAFFLTFSEWTRGNAFTGFPWNLYGYVWADHLSMAQLAHYMGAYGLTFISIVWAAMGGFLFIAHKGQKTSAVAAGAVILTMALTWVFGTYRLDTHPTLFDRDNGIVIAQPDIPQNMKWDPVAAQENFVKTVRLSKAPAGAFGAKDPKNIFVVWPETAISPSIYSIQDNMNMIGDMLATYTQSNAYLMTGILRRLESQTGADGLPQLRHTNSIALIDRALNPLAFYDKYNLVPFGEFIPMQKWIPLRPVAAFKGFQAGTGPATIEQPNIPPFSPLICYEVIFPDIVTDKYAARPRWIVNVTNDGWYGNSAGPHQHFSQTRLRAIEEGLPVIRAANTGVSGIIDPYGRVLTMAGIFTSATLTSYLPEPLSPKNPYWPWAFQIFLPFAALFLMFRILILEKFSR